MSILSTPKPPKGYEMLQFPTRGGQSANLYNQLSLGLSGGLPDILQQLLGQAQGKGSAFGPQEQQAMNFFNQQLAPSIGQRYAGSGIGASSGMQNALAGAAGNLTSNLTAQRQNLMQQSIRDVLGLGDMLLARPDIETVFQEKKPGFDWISRLGGAAKGGLSGASTGATIGSIIPGIGTGIGAGIGAGVGALGGFFTS